MKPFEELTQLGRVRRMRRLASAALEMYGLGPAHFVLARSAGNTLYRVYSREGAEKVRADGLFEPGQFLLRLHWLGYRDVGAIELELEWLRALRRECDMPVPEPVSTPDGELLIRVSHPGIPEPRYCSLLRWVRGRSIGDRAVCKHYAAQGRLMARMHDFSETWRWTGEVSPREYDCSGLFEKFPALCLPVDDVWSVLPESYRGPFDSVVQRVREAMNALGVGADARGLIHADLGVDANLLFWRGRPRAIDFDELGLGYWIYDLAVALEHCREHADFRRYRDALLNAYSGLRVLPQEQLRHLDLFMAALDVYIGLWANAVACLRPEHADVRKRAERCLRLVRAYLSSDDQHRLAPPG